jgi:hypothetical protein|tara:strand:+ start:155 stop:439 length:285 start_codon:yes stop_codon:yes gene_type:complete
MIICSRRLRKPTMRKDISVSPNRMRPRTKAGTKELARRINELISLVQRFPSRDFIDPTELLVKLNYWFSDLNGDLITTEWGYPLEEHNPDNHES